MCSLIRLVGQGIHPIKDHILDDGVGWVRGVTGKQEGFIVY